MSEHRDDNEILELTEEMASTGDHGHEGAVSEASGSAKTAAVRSSPFALLVTPEEMPRPEGRPSVPPETPFERPSGSFAMVPISSPTAVVARPIHDVGGAHRTRTKRDGKKSKDEAPAREMPAPEGAPHAPEGDDDPVLDLGAELVVTEGAAAEVQATLVPMPAHAPSAEIPAEEELPPPQIVEPDQVVAPAESPEQPEISPAPAPEPPPARVGSHDEPILELGETQVVASVLEEAPLSSGAAAPEHPFDFGTPEMVFDEIDHPGAGDEAPDGAAEEGVAVEGPESEEIDLAEAEDLTAPKLPAVGSATGEATLLPIGGREKIRRKRKRARDWWLHIFDDDFLLVAPEKAKRELRREVDFIAQALDVKPGSLVLDLACGAGGQSVAMAKRNFRVVGVDLSLSMLARAGELAQEAGQKINFIHGDMRDLGFDRTFDGVFCIGTSFGFFDEDTNRKVLESVHKALKPGGAFLLEVVNRDYVIDKQPNLTWFEGKDVVCMEETDFNFINSRLYVTRQLIIGGGVRQTKHEYSVRLYSLHEIGLILHATGFTVNHVSGNISTPGMFFGAESPRLIIRAERRP
jgi:SAM-dependent methyltransferase